MVSRFWLPVAAVAIVATGAACGQRLQVQPPVVTPATVAEVAEPVPLPPTPPEDYLIRSIFFFSNVKHYLSAFVLRLPGYEAQHLSIER